MNDNNAHRLTKNERRMKSKKERRERENSLKDVYKKQ
jgi:hypothetical protein